METPVTGSVQVAVYALFGCPLARALVSKYDGQKVCMGGCLLAALGLLSASFAATIPLLILTYSVLTGLGFGLMYLPAVVACVPYFTQRRALATGIVFCGSGVGIFTLAPVTNLILQNYGWRWVMRLLSALSGVGVMAGAVMIPVQSDSDASDISNQQHQDDDASHMTSFRKILSLILGKDLVSHPRLGHHMTFVLTNFLRFIAVYITFTHLPTFAMVSFRIYKVLSIKENAVLDPRNYCSQSSFSHLCWGNLQHSGQIHWRSLK